jgi:hypothetical protein
MFHGFMLAFTSRPRLGLITAVLAAPPFAHPLVPIFLLFPESRLSSYLQQRLEYLRLGPFSSALGGSP